MRILFLILLLFPGFLNAQQPDDWGAFVQKIDAGRHAGKRFRLEAAVRVDRIDPSAEAAIWARVDKKRGRMGFFDNMMDRPIRDAAWKVYTISGKIDKGADSLAFGGLYLRSGKFYFDEFHLFIETSKKAFEEIKILDGGFEDGDQGPAWGYHKKTSGLALSRSSENPFAGRSSGLVDGSGFRMQAPYGSLDSIGIYARVNGIGIYYEAFGAGPPLLLLHGNSQSIAAFSGQIPELAKHYRVIAVDTRGQGRSAEDGKRYSYDLFAADMAALLDHLHIDSARILGWSDGGNTALIMAMKYPHKVRRAAVMGANIFIDNTVLGKSGFRALRAMQKAFMQDTTAAGRNAARLTTMLLTEPTHTFEELTHISCPVLVMAGEKDMIRPGHTRAIAAAIPGGQLHIAPRETHFYPAENPKAFNAAVLRFFREGG